MRGEALYLRDIAGNARRLASFLENHDRESLLADGFLQSAVLYQLLVIGEAAAKVTPAFRESPPSIPWSKVVALRNIAVPAYFSVDLDTVWVTATEAAPQLGIEIESILAKEYPDPEPGQPS